MKDSINLLIEALEEYLAGNLTFQQIEDLRISPMIEQNEVGMFPENIQSLIYELDTWDAEELADSDVKRVMNELKAYVGQDN